MIAIRVCPICKKAFEGRVGVPKVYCDECTMLSDMWRWTLQEIKRLGSSKILETKMKEKMKSMRVSKRQIQHLLSLSRTNQNSQKPHAKAENLF